MAHNDNFYRVLFGEESDADHALALLGLTRGDMERYRDAGIDDGGIFVICRTGGGNREYHPNERLTSHPLYESDDDAEWDSTYAIYHFRRPGTEGEGA